MADPLAENEFQVDCITPAFTVTNLSADSIEKIAEAVARRGCDKRLYAKCIDCGEDIAITTVDRGELLAGDLICTNVACQSHQKAS